MGRVLGGGTATAQGTEVVALFLLLTVIGEASTPPNCKGGWERPSNRKPRAWEKRGRVFVALATTVRHLVVSLGLTLCWFEPLEREALNRGREASLGPFILSRDSGAS